MYSTASAEIFFAEALDCKLATLDANHHLTCFFTFRNSRNAPGNYGYRQSESPRFTTQVWCSPRAYASGEGRDSCLRKPTTNPLVHLSSDIKLHLENLSYAVGGTLWVLRESKHTALDAGSRNLEPSFDLTRHRKNKYANKMGSVFKFSSNERLTDSSESVGFNLLSYKCLFISVRFPCLSQGFTILCEEPETPTLAGFTASARTLSSGFGSSGNEAQK